MIFSLSLEEDTLQHLDVVLLCLVSYMDKEDAKRGITLEFEIR